MVACGGEDGGRADGAELTIPWAAFGKTVIPASAMTAVPTYGANFWMRPLPTSVT